MEQAHGTWGDRLRTFQTDNCLVTLLFLQPKRRCSWHFHETAYNQFTVISGKLGVKTDIGLTVLTPKQCFTVPPGRYHEFQTYNEATVIEEVAYVKYDESDIKRTKLGGPLNE
jgi:mannose-6-phosphate isomerase-like protein (cupin superfamily)